jgi:hypothetical protein
VLGRAEPRLWTPPLRELTPETSVGFDQITYAADVLGRPLLPWQRFLVVHAGEVHPDGRLRFRIVVVLVARQNGKTEVLAVLPAYWMDIDECPLIVGMCTKLEYAQDTWRKTRTLIERCEALDDAHDARWTRKTNGQDAMWLRNGARYRLAASTAEGPRSLTINRLMIDETRHTGYDVWEAAEPTTSATGGQIWCTSNAGDLNSLVLNDLRIAALQYIRTGEGDPSIGLFEWSADPRAEVDDPDALLQANPSTGHTGLRLDELIVKARAAKAAGGAALNSFKTNYLCQWVGADDPAIDPAAWRKGADPAIGLSAVAGRLALCVDVAPDTRHAVALVAGVLPDGRVLTMVAGSWSGALATREMVAALPGLCRLLRPRVVGWLPGGPAAVATADLRTPEAAVVVDGKRAARRSNWAPRGTDVQEIRGEVSAVCMGLAEQVEAGSIVHPDDPLLNDHVDAASKLYRGDVWVFDRKGAGHVTAAYAAAGAVHLARTLPASLGPVRVVTSSG